MCIARRVEIPLLRIGDPRSSRLPNRPMLRQLVANPLRLPAVVHQAGLPPGCRARRVRSAVLVPRRHAPVIAMLRLQFWSAIRHCNRLLGTHTSAVPDIRMSGRNQVRTARHLNLIRRLLSPRAAILQLPRQARRGRIQPQRRIQRFAAQMRWRLKLLRHHRSWRKGEGGHEKERKQRDAHARLTIFAGLHLCQ